MVDYRIETFLTLYETLNYHRTGEILQLSQPAVSRQIHTLVQGYGCRLFLYDGRRLTRPAAGEGATLRVWKKRLRRFFRMFRG